jgi:hypothetical protein
LGLACCLFYSIGTSKASNSGDRQAYSQESRSAAKNNQQGTKESPFFFTQIQTPESQKETANIAKDDQENEKTNRYLLYITAGLAAIAALQWIVMIMQTFHIGKSARVAEQALVDLERPFVFAYYVKLLEKDRTPIGTDIVVPHLDFGFKNFGRTPSVVRWFSCKLIVFENDKTKRIVVQKITSYNISIILTPNEFANSMKTHMGDIDWPVYGRFIATHLGMKVIFIITYDDIFKTDPRTEEFLYEYSHNLRAFCLVGGASLRSSKAKT